MIIKKILENIQYYIGTSYRRKLLDKILNENNCYFSGVVLDIGGGRKRGKFIPPKTEKWIFADITPALNPDVICNVEKMQFSNESFDVIKATELFEHVKNPADGLYECYRVLKNNGYLIISAPFLHPIHGDPYDFQRWTNTKWKNELIAIGFEIEKLVFMGRFFTVLSDMLQVLNKNMPAPMRYFFYLLYPLLSLSAKLDTSKLVLRNGLKNYTTGFFIIAKK
ncbi:MAG: class I SAM-dependent methyltransferase [Candidatus Moranbacteria bacterium]|nr:class I SAM-dependent methyltransferase [Candidatus Moranbacteria bacterium]